MALMTDKHIRHLPVCKDGKLAGVISIGDVVKAVISQQKVTIGEPRELHHGEVSIAPS
ncbi:MAG: CBS domain-containing protein [Marinilabiliales bacterium]|nr:CBS domain-containing protein [Marinilabiliales bacterium]